MFRSIFNAYFINCEMQIKSTQSFERKKLYYTKEQMFEKILVFTKGQGKQSSTFL